MWIITDAVLQVVGSWGYNIEICLSIPFRLLSLRLADLWETTVDTLSLEETDIIYEMSSEQSFDLMFKQS